MNAKRKQPTRHYQAFGNRRSVKIVDEDGGYWLNDTPREDSGRETHGSRDSDSRKGDREDDA